MYKQVIEHIDCTKCGNCCKVMHLTLTEEDPTRITNALDISPEYFKNAYLDEDKFGDLYVSKSKPCWFPENNMCTIYPFRAEVCAAYPNIAEDRFVDKLIGVIENCEICPIVYNILELLKQKLQVQTEL